MGQKVNPVGIRLGIVRDWTAKWYAGKNFSDYLQSDIQVRRFLEKKLKPAGVSHILIERPARNARITIHVAKPGIVIGKKGSDVDDLKRAVSQMMAVPVQLNIEEVKKPDLNAKLVAENIAIQLEKRVMFRRAMKRAVQNAMRQGALGIKVTVSGRLGGAEIARSEWYREGRVPLHTFRADVDYATASSYTTYGVIGIKVWIFRGEVMTRDRTKRVEENS